MIVIVSIAIVVLAFLAMKAIHDARECRDSYIEHLKRTIEWRQLLIGKPGENDDINRRYIVELKKILLLYRE